MRIADLPVTDPRPLLVEERNDLLSLLDGLSDAEWLAPTEAGHWRVKDVALHLLDDDLGWLSRDRDSDRSGLLPMDGDYRAFVRSLDEKNERWVTGAEGLSRRVVTDLLRWSGTEVTEHFAALDLAAPSRVIWAGEGPVPRWFDLCRDLTERWVHQQHIRDAVDRRDRHERFLPAVLRTFVWAFPNQYRADAAESTRVQLDLGAGGAWTLTRRDRAWDLDEGRTPEPDAALRMRETVAWRQLTGLAVPAAALALTGPEALTGPLLDVRGIIA